MKLRFYGILLIGIAFLASCRKSDGGPSADDALKNDIIERTRDIYLWNTQIPAGFDPDSYSGPEEIMDAVRVYSKEPGFSEPVDHYSFAIKKADWDNISAGVTTDFGLNVFFYTEGDLRVRMVERSSPAGLAGIKRGWKIVKINGSDNITTNNSDFIVKSIYNSPSCNVSFQKPDGEIIDISLIAAEYLEDPVYLDTLYTEGTKKVGYLVLNSFLGEVPAVASELGNVFNHFISENVTDVVIDLRYNGGGYVSLQQRLANYLIQPALNGSIMMNEEYNSNHADDNETILFEKLGTLDINNIYFIVSDNTASASELLINNLKPYMNVKLIGENTYGKPVGFYDVAVGDWLIFPVSFRSTNGLGEGNYFDGLQVDKEVPDGLDRDLGDRQEARLESVLSYIGTGSFGFTQGVPGLNSILESRIKGSNEKFNRNNFKGAIGKRKGG